MQVSISAVIPAYQRAELTVRAVESALEQTYAVTEVVVVDDGSTDGTGERAAACGPRVRVISQANAGAAAARNAGARAARGDWLAFLDSDDVWTPTHVEAMADAIVRTRGAADWYFADARLPGGAGTAWERAGLTIRGEHELRADGSAWVMLPRQPMMTPATVVARERYLAIGGQDPRLPCREDTHLFLRLGLRRPTCAVREVGAVVTAHAGADGRLTGTHTTARPAYWHATTLLYADVAERAEPAHRSELRRREAEGHWRLARLDWADRRLDGFARGAVRSLLREPRVLAARVARVAAVR